MQQLRSAAVLAAVLLLPSAAGAVSIGLVPGSQTASVGDIVLVDLVVGGLGEGGPDSLGVFDVDVFFDPAALTLTDFTVTPLLGDTTTGEALDLSFGPLGGGLVNVSVLSFLEADAASCVFCIAPFLDDLQPASFSLATFTFAVDVLPPGSVTALGVDTVFSLGDAFANPLPIAEMSGALIRAPRPSAGVPEPGTLALFAVGCAALGGVRRRSHHHQAVDERSR